MIPKCLMCHNMKGNCRGLIYAITYDLFSAPIVVVFVPSRKCTLPGKRYFTKLHRNPASISALMLFYTLCLPRTSHCISPPWLTSGSYSYALQGWEEASLGVLANNWYCLRLCYTGDKWTYRALPVSGYSPSFLSLIMLIISFHSQVVLFLVVSTLIHRCCPAVLPQVW